MRRRAGVGVVALLLIALGWALGASTIGLWTLVLVRALANGASVLGRGTGGLFVPLLVLGLIAGGLVLGCHEAERA